MKISARTVVQCAEGRAGPAATKGDRVSDGSEKNVERIVGDDEKVVDRVADRAEDEADFEAHRLETERVIDRVSDEPAEKVTD